MALGQGSVRVLRCSSVNIIPPVLHNYLNFNNICIRKKSRLIRRTFKLGSFLSQAGEPWKANSFSFNVIRSVHCFRSHSYTPAYLRTPCCRVLLEKLTGLQLVKKFPAFHGTRRFITALPNVRQLSLSWTNPIQSIYTHPTSWRSILILSTHLRLGLPSGLFPSGFPSKTLYTPLSSPIRATCPTNLILLDFITCILLGEEYKSFSFSLCSLLHSPVTSSLLGPHIHKHKHKTSIKNHT